MWFGKGATVVGTIRTRTNKAWKVVPCTYLQARSGHPQRGKPELQQNCKVEAKMERGSLWGNTGR